MSDSDDSDRPKKKAGAKRRADWQEPFLAEIERNGVIALACKRANVSEPTVRRERQRNEDFALEFAAAHERGLDVIESTLRMRGTSGQPVKKTVTKKDANGNVLEVTETTELVISTPAAMFLLKRYRPEFRESFRVENTGPGGGPVAISVAGALDELWEELDRLAAAD